MPSHPPSSTKDFTFTTGVFAYPGTAAWRFASVPQAISTEIKTHFGAKRKGWGSIPVQVTVGTTTWETSIFPDKKSQTYLLPMKLAIRKKEKIMDGDTVKIALHIQTE